MGGRRKRVGELLAHMTSVALPAQGPSEGASAVAFLMVFSMAASALEVGVRLVLREAGRRRFTFAGGKVASLAGVVGVVVGPPGDQPDDGSGQNGHAVWQVSAQRLPPSQTGRPAPYGCACHEPRPFPVPSANGSRMICNRMGSTAAADH